MSAKTLTMINEAAAEDNIRPMTRIVKLGATAMIPPTTKMTKVHNNTGRAGYRFVNLTSIGPHIARLMHKV